MPDFKQFALPDTAEGLVEADILSWHISPGDEVAVNQILVEIETAKAAVELPSPWAGMISELHAQPGDTVEVGTPIITIDVDPHGAAADEAGGNPDEGAEQAATLVGYGPTASPTTRRRRKSAATPAASAPPAEAPPAEPVPDTSASPADAVPLAKPPVRKLAKDLGVDLRSLAGSGQGGVITRDDVHAAMNGSAPAPAREPTEREHRVPIKGVRKWTAEAMVSSAFTAPHVTEFLTVDVTPMMAFRARLQASREFPGGTLTPLAFAAKAVCLAVRRTPDVNATWDADAGEIVYKDYVHLGIAAATPRGLVVPKIADADYMSLRELAVAIEELTTTARDGKSTPEDLSGSTISITNVGVFGVDTGTPIINPGESAIFAVGAIREAPWVVDGEVVVRQVVQLAVSFDHRVVDGAQGSRFLADAGALLADPAMAMAY
jgi:pyruvate dehydrogenase E2 component (dihydrolipoamide acetyltransferase)